MIKKISIFCLILFTLSLAFIYGIFVQKYKIYPYHILSNLKQNILPSEYIKNRIYVHEIDHWFNPDDSRSRYLDTSNLFQTKIIKGPNTKVFIVYGQSNTANSGQIGYKNTEKVHMFLNGKSYKYQEPSLGATGRDGNVWGRLGDKLIKKNSKIDNVYFALAGWGGKSIQELNHSPYIDLYFSHIKNVLKSFGKIDGILFQQGEANNPLDKRWNNATISGDEKYIYFLNLLFEKTKKLTDAPIWIAKTSFCGNKKPIYYNLVNQQNKFINNNKNIFHGPNTDEIREEKYRLPDKCHFSYLGLDIYSEMWFNSIINRIETK